MFASVGDNISLDEIKFSASFNDLTEGEITGNELTWKANSDQVNISETKIAPKQKGVYELTAEKNDASTTFYLFV